MGCVTRPPNVKLTPAKGPVKIINLTNNFKWIAFNSASGSDPPLKASASRFNHARARERAAAAVDTIWKMDKIQRHRCRHCHHHGQPILWCQRGIALWFS